MAELTTIAAIAFCVVLAGLAAFQTLLIAGYPLGHFAWGGQDRVLPSRLRIGSAVSIGLYAIFAVIVLDRAGVIDLLPDAVVGPAAWVLSAYLALGIAMNAISRSRPERLVMTPVAFILCGLCLIVALG